MYIKRIFLPATIIAAMALALPAGAVSWDDDDDIYYNPSSQPSTPKPESKPVARQHASQAAYVPNTVVDYPAADTYVPSGAGLDVDVDTYNRKGQFLVADSIPSDSLSANADTYNYTRRIERFYNEDVVNGSGDQELIDSYYSTSAPDINVYVVNGWGSPFYSSWAWNFGSPWYNPWYSWSWGIYDPWYSWSWGWGPAWGPGWGPAWGPGWGPGWYPGPPPVRPGHGGWAVNSPGGSRPHRPTGGSSVSTRRPGAFSAGANTAVTRPGNMGQRRPGGTSVPGYEARPAGSTTRPSTGTSGNINRGRNNYQTPSNNTETRRNYTPSRNSNQGSSRGSGSSWGRGGGGTHRSTGGGSTHGTGGGGRGRR